MDIVKNIIPKTRMYANIDSNLWTLAKKNGWNFPDLINFSIEMKIAEKNLCGYPDCELLRKVSKLTQIIQEKNELLEDYEHHFGEKMKKIKEREDKEVFKNVIGK